ncbi:MAG TPA: NlpC/P60 family protein [Chitinophagaceae bacterium]|nr:NlpC/P60 family protein [Chitinophagaceae bacterium]
MVKKFIPAIAILVLLGSCSSLRQIGLSGNKPIVPQNSASVQDAPPQKSGDVKFLNNISVSSEPVKTATIPKQVKESVKDYDFATPKTIGQTSSGPSNDNNNENDASLAALQMKYAMLLNTDASHVQNLKLFQYIDSWYGAPYRLGGTTRDGVDCSAFVQSLFATVYGVSLPRTSKYQFTATRRISTTQLKEGDLLFYHTRRNLRRVTHVGIYLQNNKFVQASSSGGVKISDMYEPYYVQHLIGAGRVINDK